VAVEPLPDLAERALAHLAGAGQVLVVRERTVTSQDQQERVQVVFTAVHEGRAWAETTDRTDDQALGAAARQALRQAAGRRAWRSGGLPQGAAAAGPISVDERLLHLSSSDLASFESQHGDRPLPLGAPAEPLEVVTAEISIASSFGVRHHERRAHVRRGAQVAARLDGLAPPWQPGEQQGAALVLSPAAVARLLARLRSAFGVDRTLGAAPFAIGDRIAPPGITLHDDARHPQQLQRAADAEGIPRRATTLIDDGVVAGAVHDSASDAPSTGHATRAATPSAVPEHLVLEPGTMPLADMLEGARPAPDDLEPLVALRHIEALSTERELVALPPGTPGGIGAALVPAARLSAIPAAALRS
jgi:hypothetical protein